MTIGEDLRVCAECGGEIPPTRKKQAKFCSDRCRNREATRRWRKAHPEKAREKNREAVRRWREANLEKNATMCRRRYHIKTYGREVTIPEMTKDRFRAARALGYRSGLEVAVARYLEENKVPFEYETLRLKYVVPEQVKTYTPDIILPNGIILELKGEFKSADRTKMKAVKAAHPDLDIRLVFSNANQKITTKSKTTHAAWAEQNGFPFAHKLPPTEWFNECKDS